MKKSDFSHLSPSEIFQSIHFLNVLIKPVHLPYHNLLEFFRHAVVGKDDTGSVEGINAFIQGGFLLFRPKNARP